MEVANCPDMNDYAEAAADSSVSSSTLLFTCLGTL